MQSIQELTHTEEHEYVKNSPHLNHRSTYQHLLEILRDALAPYEAKPETSRMLDVGAGEGSFDEMPLSRGWNVTALEMSRGAISRLQDRFSPNPSFEALFDATEDMSVLGDRQFDVILYASVLHHIPDYLRAIDKAIGRHIQPGGTLITFQDPLWYPGQTKWANGLSKIGFYSWRVFQGNWGRGLRTLGRRIRREYDESNPSDMSEYHVVRQGVNQDEILSFLRVRFQSVTLIPYWSTHSGLFQWVGERLGLTNYFAIVARGYTHDPDPISDI